MADWFLNLPVSWMALIVFVATFLIAGGVYLVVTRLADTEWARAFKAVSPGLLPVLGVLFALLVGFIAVEVWNTFDKSKDRRCHRGQRAACCCSARPQFSRGTEDAY